MNVKAIIIGLMIIFTFSACENKTNNTDIKNTDSAQIQTQTTNPTESQEELALKELNKKIESNEIYINPVKNEDAFFLILSSLSDAWKSNTISENEYQQLEQKNLLSSLNNLLDYKMSNNAIHPAIIQAINFLLDNTTDKYKVVNKIISSNVVLTQADNTYSIDFPHDNDFLNFDSKMQNLTTVQKDKYFEEIKNKPVIWEGYIDDITEDSAFVSSKNAHAMVKVDELSKPQMINFNKNDHIKFSGTIIDYNSTLLQMWILENGQIQKIE